MRARPQATARLTLVDMGTNLLSETCDLCTSNISAKFSVSAPNQLVMLNIHTHVQVAPDAPSHHESSTSFTPDTGNSVESPRLCNPISSAHLSQAQSRVTSAVSTPQRDTLTLTSSPHCERTSSILSPLVPVVPNDNISLPGGTSTIVGEHVDKPNNGVDSPSLSGAAHTNLSRQLGVELPIIDPPLPRGTDESSTINPPSRPLSLEADKSKAPPLLPQFLGVGGLPGTDKLCVPTNCPPLSPPPPMPCNSAQSPLPRPDALDSAHTASLGSDEPCGSPPTLFGVGEFRRSSPLPQAPSKRKRSDTESDLPNTHRPQSREITTNQAGMYRTLARVGHALFILLMFPFKT